MQKQLLKLFQFAVLIIYASYMPVFAKTTSHHRHAIHKKSIHTASKKTKHQKLAKKPPRIIHAATSARLYPEIEKPPSGWFVSSIEKKLVGFVNTTITGLRYSVYKLGGNHFDLSRGIYIVDCSRYVDKILRTVYPRAYSSLAASSGSDTPTTEHYYNFFNELSIRQHRYWTKIDDVEELKAGDVLVFRYKNRLGNESGGHVMLVMEKPYQAGDNFLVRVADSAAVGHSEDTRLPHTSGIGIGTLVLKVDPKTYQPYAYAWRIGSRWESRVNFAMARPIDIA